MAAGLALLPRGLPAAKPPVDEPKHFDIGRYQVDISIEGDWHAKIDKQGGYLVLTSAAGRDSDGEMAVLGVFLVTIPVAARGADRAEIATAYAVHDVAGVRKALFGSVLDLKLLSHKPRRIHDGALFEFDEPIELARGRSRSTKFVRAYVFYPSGYSRDGALYLLVGLQQFNRPEARADAIEKLEQIIVGLHATARPAEANVAPPPDRGIRVGRA